MICAAMYLGPGRADGVRQPNGGVFMVFSPREELHYRRRYVLCSGFWQIMVDGKKGV